MNVSFGQWRRRYGSFVTKLFEELREMSDEEHILDEPRALDVFIYFMYELSTKKRSSFEENNNQFYFD